MSLFTSSLSTPGRVTKPAMLGQLPGKFDQPEASRRCLKPHPDPFVIARFIFCVLCVKNNWQLLQLIFLRFLYLDNLLHCFCPAVQLVEKIWKLFFLLWQRLRCTIFGLAIVPKYPNVDIAFTGKRILVNVTVCWIRLSSFSIIYTFSISTRFQLSNNFPNSSVL